MSAQIIFSADDQAALIKLNSEGWSLRRLAARFGVSHMTIQRLLREITTPTPPPRFQVNDRAELTHDIINRRFPYFNLYRGDIVPKWPTLRTKAHWW